MADRRVRDMPVPSTHKTADGSAELRPDPEHDGGWLLTVGGVPQSYVDLADPTYLGFEYVRLMGDVIDCLGRADAGGRRAIDAVHVGGGACTLPRYVAATRPGSRQVVFEPDAALVQLVRERLPLKSVPGLKVRIADGRAGVAELPGGADDLVVLDAFAAAVMPAHLATEEFAREVRRVLRPSGVFLINSADGARLAFARRMVATLREVFRHTLLLGEPGVLRGRRFGNLIMAASAVPLPVAELTRRAAGGMIRARCMDDLALAGFCSGAAPLRDAGEITVPVPPAQLFGRP